MRRLAIACGGTGGHFYPGLSIAKAYRQKGGEVVLYIGGHHQEHQLKVARDAGFKAIPTPVIRLPRKPLQMLTFPFKFSAFTLKTMKSLKAEKIDVSLCMGSFASVPMGLASYFKSIPLVVHEGNAMMGQANRLLGRFAKLQALSFPLRHELNTKCKRELVGMPIRQEIIDAIDLANDPNEVGKIKSELGISPDKLVIMVFGGSQGARAINQAINDLIPQLSPYKDRLTFIQLTGQDDNSELQSTYAKAGIQAIVKKQDSEIQKLYIASDNIICRSGASTLYELAALGKAPLMIPFPGAKDDHQMANAKTLVDQGAGWVIPEDKVKAELLLEKIINWLEQKSTEECRKIQQFARPDAANVMCDFLRTV